MVQNVLVKILLAPFSLLYGLGVSLRNGLYQLGLLKEISFNLPVISVGNLSVGGAGKSPHIEYLIRLLQDYLEVATLSRGYRRKTKGFRVVKPTDNAEIVGDEPLQFARKFPRIYPCISESRTFGILQIVADRPQTQVILLDDAFQHRSVKPGLNILLTEYSLPFTRDYLLPSGRLREWRQAYHRADMIIVSKCPTRLSPDQRADLAREIEPLSGQRLFFSYYSYEQPYALLDPDRKIALGSDHDLLLICAIAGTDYLVEYLEAQANSVSVMEYEDHHYFNRYDMGQLLAAFERMESARKLILTTEKDAMRLELHRTWLEEKQLPIFVLPVRVRFHDDDAEAFDEAVRQFLLNFKV